MKERIRKNLCKCCIVIPFILGFIGFLEQYPGEYLDAIWFAIHLYGFDCDVEQITPILEVARWTAPLATMTTLFLAVEAVARAVLNRLALFNRNTVAIYGKSKAVNCLSEDINKHKGNHKAILANHFVSAHTHVVMLDNDEDNLLFFYRTTINSMRRTEYIFSWKILVLMR